MEARTPHGMARRLLCRALLPGGGRAILAGLACAAVAAGCFALVDRSVPHERLRADWRAAIQPAIAAACFFAAWLCVALKFHLTARRVAEHERTRAEEALRDANETLRALISASPVAIMSMDGDCLVRLWNRAAERMFGWSEGEVIGRAAPMIPAEMRRSLNRLWRRVMAGEELTAVEIKRRRRDGALIDISVSAAAVCDPDGKPAGVIAVLEDITNRKRAEEQLRQHASDLEAASARLEQQAAELAGARDQALVAARAKAEFLATMSHEIRTPLNGIMGMNGLLLDTELDEEQREYAGIVASSARNLLAIINDILDFSKMEAGRVELDAVDFGVRQVIEETLSVLSLKAAEKGLTLASSIPPDVPETLRGDSGRLRQILLNLAGNAVKFTQAGGVTVSAAVQEAARGAVTLRFEVADTGIGIPPEAMGHLFQSFSQLDASASRKHGGTGLGLAISKRLAELMGGQIGVESRPGEGSTFWFTAGFAEERGAGSGEQAA